MMMKTFKNWICSKLGHNFKILAVEPEQTLYICKRCGYTMSIKNKR